MTHPHIDGTEFGAITVNGTAFEYDIVIRLDGEIVKRKKKLSKRIHGTSHTISKDEAKFLYEGGCERIIIGAGQYDTARLSPDAERYFAKRECAVDVCSTPDALARYNAATGATVAMFHVTC